MGDASGVCHHFIPWPDWFIIGHEIKYLRLISHAIMVIGDTKTQAAILQSLIIRPCATSQA
jgi:hypothetical protein